MNVTEFEDKRWSSFAQKAEFRHKAACELLTGAAGVSGGTKETVLDFACGDGLLLSMLKEKGIQAAGCDVSGEAVKRCSEKGFKVDLMKVGEKWPYADGAFDHVVMLDVLEHVYDPQTLLTEAKRVARKSVIVGTPNFSSLPARLQTLMGKVPENNHPHKGHVYWFNHPVMKRECEKAGLASVEWKMNTFSPATLFGLGDFFTKLMPNAFALSFVVKLEKK
jgi:methionine biosynthesis protein MetW